MDEYGSDGDLLPVAAFSSSSSKSASDEYDSEVDDPSTFPEFDNDDDDDEIQQLFDPSGSTTARTVVADVLRIPSAMNMTSAVIRLPWLLRILSRQTSS